jgi:hypothetical protein
MKNIIWLTSYPKSGNTWFRMFLSALLHSKELDINKPKTDGLFSSKHFVETILDVDADLLNTRQIEVFQRQTFEYLSAMANKTMYVKIHDAFTFSETDRLPLIPEAATKMAICFVRNPLDVTLSLANHTGRSIEKTIEEFIVNPTGAFIRKANSPHNQFRQPLGTWSMHIESWVQYPTFPVHFMRYEDMKSQPFETFKAATTAMELNVTNEQIKRAIAETEFEKLQKKEQEKEFKEKHNHNSSFFFRGQVGRWKEELTNEQIEKIRQANEPMMRHFGYW